MGAITSESGDKWCDEYPPVISGHIHDAQTVGENVFYPGSSIQHAFGESPDKRVWFVTFGECEASSQTADAIADFTVEKISLGMKGKRIFTMTADEVYKFDYNKAVNKNIIKINIRGTSEELKVFKKSKRHKELVNASVKMVYKLNETPKGSKELEESDDPDLDKTNYLSTLERVVSGKSRAVQQAYQTVMGVTIPTEGNSDEGVDNSTPSSGSSSATVLVFEEYIEE
jgi:hypothetical protein